MEQVCSKTLLNTSATRGAVSESMATPMNSDRRKVLLLNWQKFGWRHSLNRMTNSLMVEGRIAAFSNMSMNSRMEGRIGTLGYKPTTSKDTRIDWVGRDSDAESLFSKLTELRVAKKASKSVTLRNHRIRVNQRGFKNWFLILFKDEIGFGTLQGLRSKLADEIMCG